MMKMIYNYAASKTYGAHPLVRYGDTPLVGYDSTPCEGYGGTPLEGYQTGLRSLCGRGLLPIGL